MSHRHLPPSGNADRATDRTPTSLARLVQHADIVQQPDSHPVEVRLALVPRPPEAGRGKVEGEAQVKVNVKAKVEDEDLLLGRCRESVGGDGDFSP